MGSPLMKRLTISITCLMTALTAMAQFNWDDPKLNWAWDNNRHSFSLTAGYNSFMGIDAKNFITNAIIPEFERRGYDLTKEDINKNQPYGNYGIQYHYNFLKWLRFGVKLDFDVNKLTINNDVKTIFYSNVLPSLQFTYYNTDYWRVYSGIDAGISILVFPKMLTLPMPAINITPIGFSYGRGIIVFVETNIGFDAIIKGGVGLRL